MKEVDDNVPYWVGRMVLCEKCEKRFQLEEGDEAAVAFIHQGTVFASVGCPKCGNSIIFKD